MRTCIRSASRRRAGSNCRTTIPKKVLTRVACEKTETASTDRAVTFLVRHITGAHISGTDKGALGHGAVRQMGLHAHEVAAGPSCVRAHHFAGKDGQLLCGIHVTLRAPPRRPRSRCSSG